MTPENVANPLKANGNANQLMCLNLMYEDLDQMSSANCARHAGCSKSSGTQMDAWVATMQSSRQNWAWDAVDTLLCAANECTT